MAAMAEVLGDLEAVLRQRRDERPEGSYSATLFADRELLLRKVMEEAFEVCLEFGRPSPDRDRVTAEVADLLFHVLAGLVSTGVALDDVVAELGRRRR